MQLTVSWTITTSPDELHGVGVGTGRRAQSRMARQAVRRGRKVSYRFYRTDVYVSRSRDTL